MNRKQKTAVVIGALAVVALSLFPPFMPVDYGSGGGDLRFWWFMQSPPLDDPQDPVGHWVDSRLVGLQLAALTLTIAAVVLLADKKRPLVADTFE